MPRETRSSQRTKSPTKSINSATAGIKIILIKSDYSIYFAAKLPTKSTIVSGCGWPSNDALMLEYHDNEWGVPTHDDRKLFEYMLLDAFQAGLSWRTVLHKRLNFAAAFAQFDVNKVAQFDASHIDTLMSDSGIIRNRLKINAAITNARLFIDVQREFGSFDAFIWRFTNGVVIDRRWTDLVQIPTRNDESDAMSVELRRRGFRFVGTTICYAFMQAIGMINDHLVSCPRHAAVQKL
jgi:DNA-3-methyladenine glycosylase I